jgi:hypothetical protein
MRKIVYLAAILMVALVFMGAGCGKKNQVQNQGEEVTTEEFQATLEEMAKKGKPYVCEYSLTTEGVEQKGTMYIAGEKKLRGDVTVNMPQTGETVSHFIVDGETQYFWGDDQTDGMKMTVTAEDEARMKAQAEQSEQQSVDMDTKANLKCKKWSINAGMFAPPSGIKFQDLNELMNSVQNMTGGASGASAGSAGSGQFDICGMCNAVPAGDARNECVKQNCN